ncbi:hypothetical protein GCM10010219_02750 [Streptomyces netropsis]|nr:hypothetical protein GCM10010219_02750 [Streptomyces netropsis]
MGVCLGEQSPLVGVESLAGVQEQPQARKGQAVCAQVDGKADEEAGGGEDDAGRLLLQDPGDVVQVGVCGSPRR